MPWEQAVALSIPAVGEGTGGSGMDPRLLVSWAPSPVRALVSQPREHFPVSPCCRFSTKSWLSQVCHVCQKSMMFGVKCKHCR